MCNTKYLWTVVDKQHTWERWTQDDNARAEVPMTDAYEDAFPKGVGISIDSQRLIPLSE